MRLYAHIMPIYTGSWCSLLISWLGFAADEQVL